MEAKIGYFILFIVALVFSLSLHEAGHAWMSNRFGDDLAKSQGRITLNPMSHVDPIGTLLFPAISFFTGAALLGWAKPTPVNPLRWRDKRLANFWVSIAGVMCNLAIAIVSGALLRVLFASGNMLPRGFKHVAFGGDDPLMSGLVLLLYIFFTLNVGLIVFNLLPIPPLDGGRILSSILPDSFDSALAVLDQYGWVILIMLVFTGALGPMFRVIIDTAVSILMIGA